MEFPLTVPQWMLASLVVLCGTLVQGSIGYGVGLIGAPLLFLIHPILVPAPVVVIGMVVPGLILLREWRAVRPAEVAWAMPGSIAGTALAGLLLGLVTDRTLGLLFGILVLAAVGLSMAGRVPRRSPAHLVTAAGLSGFMGTTTGIGGPPLALLYQASTGPRLRGTLSAIFVPTAVLALLALGQAQRFGPVELLLGISLLPAVIAGFVLSIPLAGVLDRRWLRPVVLAVSALAATVAIARALTG